MDGADRGGDSVRNFRAPDYQRKTTSLRSHRRRIHLPMNESILDKVAEYQAALMENAELAAQENSLKSARSAARSRLNQAKDNLRALEEDMMYLQELQIINHNVKETV